MVLIRSNKNELVKAERMKVKALFASRVEGVFHFFLPVRDVSPKVPTAYPANDSSSRKACPDQTASAENLGKISLPPILYFSLRKI